MTPGFPGRGVLATAAVLPLLMALTGCQPVTDADGDLSGGSPSVGPTTDDPTNDPTMPDGAGVTVLTEIPESLAGVDLLDSAVAHIAWSDVAGDHLVVLRDLTDGELVPGADGALPWTLQATHYVPEDSAPDTAEDGRDDLEAGAAIAGRIEIEVRDCGDADLVDRFYEGTLAVADANDDGAGEATFGYAEGCATDVIATVTAAMFTNSDLYTVAGQRNVIGLVDNAARPETVDVPPEATAFRDVLLDLWNSDLAEDGGTDSDATRDIIDWAGDYAWSERLPGDVDPPALRVHELTLAAGDGSSLTGQLLITGTQVDETYDVRATQSADIVSVSVTGNDGDAQYGAKTELFRLSGDPAAPTTTLVVLETVDPGASTTGTLFKPVDDSTDGVRLDAWVGDYTWSQTADGDPGSPQTTTYDLSLTGQENATFLTGDIAVTGFQTADTYRVRADPAPDTDDTINVLVLEASDGAAYQNGDVLFSLSGDPVSPTTTLVDLDPLLSDTPATGSYFQPVDSGHSGDEPEYLAGTPGVTTADSLVVQRYGESGPQTAVAPATGPAGTAASGCRPGDDSTLPDGVWAGDLRNIGTSVASFDLACYYTVDAVRASGADIGPLEDFRIVNDVDRVRTNLLDADALTVHLQTSPPVAPVGEPTETVSYDFSGLDQLRAYLDAEGPTFGFLVVEDGKAVEFYSPPLASA